MAPSADSARSHRMACSTPVATAGLLPYGSLGQWDEVAHFQNGNSTLGEKTWPYRPPSFPPRLNRAPRPLPALACLCVLAVSAIPVLHCGGPRLAGSVHNTWALASKGAAGGHSTPLRAKASGIRHDARARLPPLQSGGLPPSGMLGVRRAMIGLLLALPGPRCGSCGW